MISLIHPSRGRPELALRAYRHWIDHAATPDQIEYILSIDHSDRDQIKYTSCQEFPDDCIIINHNRSIVDAVNNAAARSTGDIMVVMSDDFMCPAHWDSLITKRMSAFCALHVNDTIQQNIITLPILTRSVYDRLGFIYHPHYLSMYADNDLTDCCKLIGAYTPAFDLTFQHQHYVNGFRKMDETYKRENSKQAWQVGKKVYQDRASRKFDISI